MIRVYADFAEQWLAVPVIVGHKSDSERFAGAEDTLTIEALMQDAKLCRAVHRISSDRTSPKRSMYSSRTGKVNWITFGRLPGAYRPA